MRYSLLILCRETYIYTNLWAANYSENKLSVPAGLSVVWCDFGQ